MYNMHMQHAHAPCTLVQAVTLLLQARALLAQGVHGVMLGRRARDEPYISHVPETSTVPRAAAHTARGAQCSAVPCAVLCACRVQCM